MAASSRTYPETFFPYIGPLALVAVAAGFIWSQAVTWGLLVLMLAGISFLVTRFYVKKLSEQAVARLLEDDRLLQTQKLAALGELAAGLAHELNNPLAIIRQEAEWADRLLNQAPDFPELVEIRDSLREIRQQVERSGEITHNLLTLARKQKPILQKVDLNRLVESMAVLVEREARPRNIDLVRNYQADLPQVWTDPPLLRQVILNLLNNARQALKGPGTITLTSRMAGSEHVELVVQDTGEGIAPEHLQRIFDPFFTTKPPGQGTGLGLALSYSIVHKLGGHIQVTSRLGEGSTFTVRLPLRPKEVQAYGETAHRPSGGR